MEWSISLQPQEELAAFARFGNAVASLCVEKKGARACLKNHFRNLQAPLCGIFYPHSVAVARYAALIRINSPTNWNSQLTKSLFQTRSNSHIRVSMSDDRIEILLFILLRTAYWTAFNLPDVEFIVIGRSLTRIPVRYKLIDS